MMMTLFRTFKNKNKNYKARNLSLSVILKSVELSIQCLTFLHLTAHQRKCSFESGHEILSIFKHF